MGKYHHTFCLQKLCLKILCWGVFFCVLSACNSDKEELRKIKQFHEKYIDFSADKLDKNKKFTKVYLDFSPSCLQLFGDFRKHITPATLKTFLPSDVQLFWFGGHFPIPFDEKIEPQILDSLAQQIDSVSLVKEVLQKIVQENQNAVLITDFEYVPRKNYAYRAVTQQGDTTFTRINPYPWATPLFERWFEQGNALKVVSFPDFDTLKNSPKNLYGLFFLTPNSEKDLSIILEKNKNLIDKKFVLYYFLGLSDIHIKAQHFDRFSGAIHPDIISAEFIENQAIEYYSLKYEDIQKYLKPDQQGIFLQNLMPQIDTALFGNLSFETEIVDFTEDFSYFLNFQEHEPVRYGIDPNTGDSTIIKAPSISFRFTGGMPVKGIFNTVYDSAKNRLGLQITDKLRAIKWDEKGKLYGITIRLKTIRFMPAESLKKNLQTTHYQGFKNESLYKSLLGAYSAKRLNSLVLYRCYLRLY